MARRSMKQQREQLFDHGFVACRNHPTAQATRSRFVRDGVRMCNACAQMPTKNRPAPALRTSYSVDLLEELKPYRKPFDFEKQPPDDPEDVRRVLTTWREEFGDRVVRASDLKPRTSTGALLLRGRPWSHPQIWWRLQWMEDRVAGGLKLIKVRGAEAGWKVISIGC
jgi:hypothetical protein